MQINNIQKITSLINNWKNIILEKWLNDDNAIIFMKNFWINEEEKIHNLKFIWERLLNFFIENIDKDITINCKWCGFFTTKFVDFMYIKQIDIDEFISLMSIIKEKLIIICLNDLKLQIIIDTTFSKLNTLILRNYFDLTTKLLNEYQKVLNSTWPVAKTNINWIITFVNDEFCSLSWYSKDELIWEHFSFLPHPEEVENNFFESINLTIKSKKNWNWFVKSIKKDWTVYWVKSAIIPIIDENDNILECIWVRTDITDLELTRQNLHDSYEKLKELDAKKDEFLNIASHELRTPLTALKWYLSMILDWDFGKISTKICWIIEQSYENTLRLINIVNDMFDISRIETWTMIFNKDKVDIFKFLSSLCDDMKVVGKIRKSAFFCQIDEKLKWCLVETDFDKITQVISNLIINSFKFIDKKSWEVKLKADLEGNKVCIKVIDNGIWIAKDKLDKIFLKFYQVDSYVHRREEWLWLWLTLSQNILTNLWSEIFVKSEEWIWSEFYFYIEIIN